MSEIYIHYGNLEDTIQKSKKIRSGISDYIDNIKKEITSPINKLPGNDSAGYTSTATNLALQKINDLNSKATDFFNFESRVSDFISTAKEIDGCVSSKIETISSMYIEKRSWIQNASDWIYNTFCCDLANKWDLVKDFKDVIVWINGKAETHLDKIVDWFKYGDGKYVLNIVEAFGTVIASVVVTIVAIASIPFSGGTSTGISLPVIFGCIAAIASSVSTIITMANAASTIDGNSRALSYSGDFWKFDDRDGNPAAARFYGDISSVSEEWSKKDFGDESRNNRFKTYGKIIDTTKVVADTVKFVADIALSFAAFRDYRFKNPDDHIKRYSFKSKNLIHSVKGEFGFYVSKEQWVIKDFAKFGRKVISTIDDFDFIGDRINNLIDIADGKDIYPDSNGEPFDRIESITEDFESLEKIEPFLD